MFQSLIIIRPAGRTFSTPGLEEADHVSKYQMFNSHNLVHFEEKTFIRSRV